jgi:hypothetical protein
MQQASAQWLEPLRTFVEENDLSNTFLALDLDGTALLEDKGKVFISSSVEKGVKALRDLNIPVVLNSLRFPLSVIDAVGEAWCQIASAPIPVVLLNGSTIGCINRSDGQMFYEEFAAIPVARDEVQGVLDGIAQLIKAGIDDLLFFFYPRDWKEGDSVTSNEDVRSLSGAVPFCSNG